MTVETGGGWSVAHYTSDPANTAVVPLLGPPSPGVARQSNLAVVPDFDTADSGSSPDGVAVDVAPLRTVALRRSVYVTVLKPAFDRLAAAAGLLVAMVPMLVIALVVAITMGRPVLYRQRRVGLNGEIFEVLKFRSMQHDRRAQRLDILHDRRVTHKSDRDPRHTRVGRFLRRYSLDELPQLFNVLRGEMSIIGPRPELESVVEKYPPGLDQRHLVKPGLTGLWQISARGDGPMHENGQWDLDYVEQVSIRTDLRILTKTPAAMFGDNTGA